VEVGQDIAVGRDDHAGSEAALLGRGLLALSATGSVTELTAELLAEKSAQHVVIRLLKLCRLRLSLSFDANRDNGGDTTLTTSAYESRPPAMA